MQLEPYIKEIANKNNEEEWVGIVDPGKIKLGSRNYVLQIHGFSYHPSMYRGGSLDNCQKGWYQKINSTNFHLASSVICVLMVCVIVDR